MEKRTVDKRTITLFLGCGRRRYRITIPLITRYYDEWYEQRLKNWNIEPKDISSIELGPRTVVELYSSAFFYGDRRVVKNPSFSQINMYDIGCLEDHHIWHGYIRSFRLWDYDYYEKIHSIQACTHHSDCRDDEYCLCPNGFARKEWCRDTGRFCFPKSRYLQSRPKDVAEGDLVNLDCLSDRLGPKPYAQFSTIRNDSSRCSGPNVVYPPLMNQEETKMETMENIEGMCSMDRPNSFYLGMPDDQSSLESCGLPYYNSIQRGNIEGFGNVRGSRLFVIIILILLLYVVYKNY